MKGPLALRWQTLGMLVVVAASAGTLLGCGGSESVGVPDLAADVAAGATDVTAATGDLPSAGVFLTLKLNTTLDKSPGAVKVSSITKGELLNTAGALVKNGKLITNGVKFNLSGVAAGSYFIRVNSLADDLVPTRIDNPAVSVTQFVGQRLRDSVIGTIAAPTYRIKTFSLGQGSSPVVRYSNGAAATPTAYAYAMMLGSTTLETRALGTNALLSSRTHKGPHTFKTWLLGPTNHGRSSMNCGDCHGNTNSHPSSYATITKSNGFCFKCHYGPTGPSRGMVQPAQ